MKFGTLNLNLAIIYGSRTNKLFNLHLYLFIIYVILYYLKLKMNINLYIEL